MCYIGNLQIASIANKERFERKLADSPPDFISEWLGPLLDRELTEPGDQGCSLGRR
jgi:hypothetical protein